MYRQLNQRCFNLLYVYHFVVEFDCHPRQLVSTSLIVTIRIVHDNAFVCNWMRTTVSDVSVECLHGCCKRRTLQLILTRKKNTDRSAQCVFLSNVLQLHCLFCNCMKQCKLLGDNTRQLGVFVSWQGTQEGGNGMFLMSLIREVPSVLAAFLYGDREF